MANALGRDLRHREIVLLRAEGMKPEFRSIEARKVYALGGFGAMSETMGRCLLIEHVSDGERYSVDSYDIEEFKEESP
jgi:hypothetical protein